MMSIVRQFMAPSPCKGQVIDHFMLRLDRHPAICSAMLGRITSLIMTIILLFGTVILPSVAHAAAPAHEEESFERHDHDATSDPVEPEEGDKPCHVVTHHHCSFALRIDPDPVKTQLSGRGSKSRPVSSLAMPSWSQAPPTEPPLA